MVPTYKYIRLCLVCAAVFCAVAGIAEAESKTVSSIIQDASELGDIDKVLEYTSSALKKLPNGAEKREVLVFRGRLLEQAGRYAEAASSYYDAAFIDGKGRDDALILDAVLCLLASGDADKAEEYLKPVILTSFDDALLARARLYSSWMEIIRGEDPDLLRSYLTSPAMESVRPAILFTLWWTQNDASAGETLTKTYPGTPEAAIVRGDARPLPGGLWYFIPRASVAAVSPEAVPPQIQPKVDVPVKVPTDGAGTAGAAVPGSDSAGTDKVVWQQLGFFRSSENADALIKKLRDKGFEPEILKQPRPSGTVYLAVVVRENADGTMGQRLKNAGFECFPIFE